jgi:hypothetical protein
MLGGVKAWWRGTPRAEQLGLGLEGLAPALNGDDLLARLRAAGLKNIETCSVTQNRSVMVSFRGTALRVHEGYLAAPPTVLRAIAAFVNGRTRVKRREARDEIMAFAAGFPARERTTVPRRERTRADDEPIAARLVEWHARYNAERFEGALKPVPIRVSRRMRRRLGHYVVGAAPEIAISWRHLRRHGWEPVLQTLLHEMVHQWQHETLGVVDHGPRFRAKAREVGTR